MLRQAYDHEMEQSSVVNAALRASQELSDWINTHHPDGVPHERSSVWAATFYAICLDHRVSIHLLVDHGQRSSAFTLMRATYEALIRGLWAETCADDRDFEQLANTGAQPKFETIIRRLDAHTPVGPSYAETKAKAWAPMSEFVHGGLMQLSRWAGKDGIGPRHPDEETADLLTRVDLYGALACMHVARLAGMSIEEHARKVEDLTAALASRPDRPRG